MSKNERFNLDSILDSVTDQAEKEAGRSGADDEAASQLNLPRPQKYRSGGSRAKPQTETYGGQTVHRNGTVKRGYYLSTEVIRALRARVYAGGNCTNASAIVEAALRQYLGLPAQVAEKKKGGDFFAVDESQTTGPKSAER